MKVWELKVLKKIVDREIKGVWSKITEKSKTCKTLGEKFLVSGGSREEKGYKPCNTG